MVIQKYKNHALANAIRKNHEAGMKAIEIAKLFKISPQRINYWIHTEVVPRKRRFSFLVRFVLLFLGTTSV